MRKKPIDNRIKWTFGVGYMFFVLSGTFHGYYLNFILTDIMRIPLASTAIITSFSSIGQIILATISGFVIQAIKPGKMGRYRKTLMLLPIIYFLVIWSGYTQVTTNTVVLVAFLTCTPSITKWLNSLTTSSRNMLMAEISPDGETRSLLSGHNAVYGGFGKILYSLVIVGLLGFVQSITSEAASYPIIMEIFMFTAILGTLYEIHITKGYDTTAETDGAEVKTEASENQAAVPVKKEKPSFLLTIKAAFASLPLASISLSYMATRIVQLMGSGLLVYYYTYVAEDRTLQTVATTAISTLVMITGIIMPMIAKKVGNKYTYLLCLLMALGGHAVCYFFGLNSAMAFTVGAVFICGSMDAMLVPLIAMFGDCAVYNEWKSGQENKAITMNMYSVFGSLSGFIRNALQPMALGMAGYVAGEVASLQVKQGLMNAYSVIPVICLIIGFSLVFFGYRISSADIKRMQSEIDARKAGETV